jgi:hypothetical protein
VTSWPLVREVQYQPVAKVGRHAPVVEVEEVHVPAAEEEGQLVLEVAVEVPADEAALVVVEGVACRATFLVVDLCTNRRPTNHRLDTEAPGALTEA